MLIIYLHCRPHLLEEEDPFHLEIEHKPLTPLEIPDFDPFDTSIAEGVIPGKTEIRVLGTWLKIKFIRLIKGLHWYRNMTMYSWSILIRSNDTYKKL